MFFKTMRAISLLIVIQLLTACGAPSQDELISNFNKNKAVFEKLAINDSICPKPENSILWASDELIKNSECKELLQSANLRGISQTRKSPTNFYYKSRSYTLDMIDYAYYPNYQGQKYSSLKKAMSQAQPYEQAYVEIEKDWYLVYVCNCG